MPDYYKGTTIRVYDETQFTYPCEAIVASQTYTVGEGITWVLENGWAVDPADTLNAAFQAAKIETAPLIPGGYDSIYAFDAAIRILGQRGGQAQRRKELAEERQELFSACQAFVLSTVADRGPTRGTYIDTTDEPDSGYETGHDFY